MSKSVRSKMRFGVLAIPLCLAAFTTTPVFAEDDDFDPPPTERDAGCTIEEETDGDCGAPVKGANPKAPPKAKVHSKMLTTYSAREALRYKFNKDAFIDAYSDQTIGTQSVPIAASSSKLSGGLNVNFLVSGFTLTAGIDRLRNYTGTYANWNNQTDNTYSFGASRKINLSPQWTLTPSVKQTRLVSDTATKEFSKTDLSLPLSYALNKLWTIKALTFAFSKQDFANREFDQTDRTWTLSTGVAYKWSAKSTVEIAVNRQVRRSDLTSAEFLKTTILPKYEYKFTPTSTVSMGIGYERHANSVEQFGRWILAPKVQLRWDL